MAVVVGGHMAVVMVEHLAMVVVMELHLAQEVTELLEVIPNHLCHRGPLQVAWQQGEVVWGGQRIWEAV